LLVTFQLKIARLLPPSDEITVPVLRLFMAADDLRRSRIRLIDAHERLGGPPTPEKSQAMGDFLYSLRLLFSHLHEAGHAMRSLDSKAAARVDAMLAGNTEALAALQAVRTEFNDRAYKESLIHRLRNGIGFHYRADTIGQLVAKFDDDTILESTGAQVGGLARIADPLIKVILDDFVGGDFTSEELYSQEMGRWLKTVGNLLIFVDHLFNTLIVPGSVVSVSETVVEVPIGVQRAREALQAARRKRVEGG
jgi:hypothetical protein